MYDDICARSEKYMIVVLKKQSKRGICTSSISTLGGRGYSIFTCTSIKLSMTTGTCKPTSTAVPFILLCILSINWKNPSHEKTIITTQLCKNTHNSTELLHIMLHESVH